VSLPIRSWHESSLSLKSPVLHPTPGRCITHAVEKGSLKSQKLMNQAMNPVLALPSTELCVGVNNQCSWCAYTPKNSWRSHWRFQLFVPKGQVLHEATKCSHQSRTLWPDMPCDCCGHLDLQHTKSGSHHWLTPSGNISWSALSFPCRVLQKIWLLSFAYVHGNLKLCFSISVPLHLELKRVSAHLTDGSSVSIQTRLWAGRPGFYSWQGQWCKFFSSSPRLVRL
jgi:hypothetical protein